MAAADTDLVFGFVSEEWGLLIALCCAGLSDPVRAVCGAVRLPGPIRVFRYRGLRGGGDVPVSGGAEHFRLHGFAAADGVTFPLVSNGGSSMAANFAMLAFIRAVGLENTGPPAAGKGQVPLNRQA